MSFNCDAFTHIPESCKDGNGLLLPKDLIVSNPGYSIETFMLAGAEETYRTGIINDELYVIHGVKGYEDKTPEPTFADTDSGDAIFLFEGNLRMRFQYYMSVGQHKALRSMRGKKCGLNIGDRKGNLMGTSPDGVIFRGFKGRIIDVSSLKPGSASDAAYSYIEIQLENPEEFNETLHIIEPYSGTAADNWYPYDLPTKTTVIVEQVGAIATDIVTFDVKKQSNGVTNNAGNPVTDAGITGLDVDTYTNFQFVVGGTVTAPTSMTEVAGFEGRYTVEIAGITTGDTIQILPVVTDEKFYTSIATAVTT